MQRLKTKSIQFHIFTYCLCVLLLVGAGILLAITDKVSHETQEVFDASLVQSTMLVKNIIPEALEFEDDELPQSLSFESESEFSASLLEQTQSERAAKSYYENTTVIFLQSASGEALLSSDQKIALPVITKEGFSQQIIDSKSWRIFSVLDTEHDIWISSAQQQETRQELSRELATAVLPSFLIGALLIFLGIYFGVRRGFKPLTVISTELDQRRSDNLAAIETHQLPTELDTVIHALNNLFSKVEQAMKREQGFTDDAAHQLRTPLAAMFVHLDSLPKEDATSMALNKAVATMDRLVSQLLELARLSPQSHQSLSFSSVDIKALCADVIAQLHPLARSRQISLELISNANASIMANPILLEILITNLVENAIRYSDQGDYIQVSLDHTSPNNNDDSNSRIQVSVVDHGPGLSDSEKTKVWSRFYRADASNQLGSGLGLAIVKEICLLHLADYNLLDTPNGGLTIVINLPINNALSE